MHQRSVASTYSPCHLIADFLGSLPLGITLLLTLPTLRTTIFPHPSFPFMAENTGLGSILTCAKELVSREQGLGWEARLWILHRPHVINMQSFPGGSVVKNSPGKQETRIQSLGREDPLEKEIEAHYSILAWRIPWTEYTKLCTPFSILQLCVPTPLNSLMVIHQWYWTPRMKIWGWSVTHFNPNCSLVYNSVTKPCPTLCEPMDCSPSHSSVHRISQARILKWVATSHSRASSRPRDQIEVSCVSCIGRRILYHWATWEAQLVGIY